LVQEFSYLVEVKEEAIRLRLAGVPVAEVMESIGIKSETQLQSWMKWYRNG